MSLILTERYFTTTKTQPVNHGLHRVPFILVKLNSAPLWNRKSTLDEFYLIR